MKKTKNRNTLKKLKNKPRFLIDLKYRVSLPLIPNRPKLLNILLKDDLPYRYVSAELESSKQWPFFTENGLIFHDNVWNINYKKKKLKQKEDYIFMNLLYYDNAKIHKTLDPPQHVSLQNISWTLQSRLLTKKNNYREKITYKKEKDLRNMYSYCILFD